MKKIIIIGAGFSGLFSALSAARLRETMGAESDLEIVIVAPQPILNVRPRFYEDDPLRMKTSLADLLRVTNVRFIAGYVHTINNAESTIIIDQPDSEQIVVSYDRLIIAAGSRLVHPPIPGLREHCFNVDQRQDADKLWQHMHGLAARPASVERDTVVIAGGGFTGIETAAEMPHRMRSILGENANIRVIVVERNEVIGPDLGSGPRSVIEEAFRSLGVEMILGKALAAVDAAGATLSDGSHIPSSTVIWTGGPRATLLTEQLDAPRDTLGRLMVDRDLRVPGYPQIFATGDAANAATDDDGHRTLMSCQHAMPLGRFSGHNAAADLLGQPVMPYSQERYVTCLDLGPWGAAFCEGWDRKVILREQEGKERKRIINQVHIYPPEADRAAAFAAAQPGITADA